MEAMRRLREKMKSPRKIERKGVVIAPITTTCSCPLHFTTAYTRSPASELLIVEPTTGEVLYIDSAGDANEIFYSEV